MNNQHILLKLWMSFALAASSLNLPEIIYKKCPYSDICNRTASMSLNVKGLVPCCSSCKCDDDCGLRLDCCFDDIDKYRLKDKGIVKCVNPFIGDKRDDIFNRAYWMIQTCKNDTEDGLKTNRNIQCEVYNSNGQYIIDPVSSKEKGYIYVNADCAICNNVYNFTKWNYLRIAKHKQVGPSIWEIIYNRNIQSESVVYIPPQGEDWSTKRCFKNFLEPCDTNLTFQNLCFNFRAPYQLGWGSSFYRNLFCTKCENRYDLPTKCKDEYERAPSSSFTVLIDNSVIALSKLRKNVAIIKRLKPDNPNEMSVRPDSDSSLAVYCPDGMLMTQTGCRYFINRWYIPSFRLQLKLWATEETELHIATLNALTLEERNNPLLWIKLPCRQVKPSMLDVFYEIGKDKVESFLVRLWKLTPGGIYPSIIFPRLKKCLKDNWYLEILGKSYSFHPTFDKQSDYIQDGQQTRVNKVTNEREDAKRPKLYERIAIGPGSTREFSAGRGKPLLKTLFCDQINLPMDDVEVLFGEIRIPSKNVTLGNNEFMVNFFVTRINSKIIRDLSKATFSICLEDYDNSYNQSGSKSSVSSRTFLLGRMVIYYVTIRNGI